MKNMVVLKSLPSNIVEEAFVVFKPNIKLKLEDYAEKKDKDKHITTKFGARDYMIREAEMIISNYLSNIENNKRTKNINISKIQSKYNRLKKLTYILAITVILNAILILL